jgi:alpha-tubulin suppressor-like RCC1 family protein
MKADGSLWGWGKNNGGNLGQNQAEAQLEAASSPVQVPGTTWSFVQSGTYRTGALKTDGTLWMWGWNNDGGLGQNQSAPEARSSPVQVPGTNWSKISIDGYATLATKTDGTLWAWGPNNRGQLGQQGSENADASSPVQIPGTTWENVNFCQDAVFATKTDNTAWVWGRNDYGQLGLNQSFDQANYKNSPMQIPGTNWPRTRNKFGVGPGMMAAIKTDGTLWSWGYNKRGQLGQNSSGTSTNRRSSPTQVGSNTNWDRLHLSAGDTVVASKTDGTLWAWGSNTDGQLGINGGGNRSSPTQIPGTDWNLDEVYGNTPIGVQACFQD